MAHLTLQSHGVVSGQGRAEAYPLTFRRMEQWD